MADQFIMAKSIGEAVAWKEGSAVFIAGGTEANRLGSAVKDGADTLISLKKCSELGSIRTGYGSIVIGSMCTFQQLIESDQVPQYLKDAACFMASRTKRNMATIGGNIASARDDSYLLPTLIAAGAVLQLVSKTYICDVGIGDYLENRDSYAEALITKVEVPKEAEVVSKRYSNTAQSHAVLTMSARKNKKGMLIAAALKNSGIYILADLEKAFAGRTQISDDEIIGWFRDHKGIKAEDDMFGSAAYKRYLMGVTAADMYRQLKAEA